MRRVGHDHEHLGTLISGRFMTLTLLLGADLHGAERLHVPAVSARSSPGTCNLHLGEHRLHLAFLHANLGLRRSSPRRVNSLNLVLHGSPPLAVLRLILRASLPRFLGACPAAHRYAHLNIPVTITEGELEPPVASLTVTEFKGVDIDPDVALRLVRWMGLTLEDLLGVHEPGDVEPAHVITSAKVSFASLLRLVLRHVEREDKSVV